MSALGVCRFMAIENTVRDLEDTEITLDKLSRDPEAIYSPLRRSSPVVWAPRLDMWLVVRHADVKAVLGNSKDYVTGTADSLIWQAFGENMLTTDGQRHREYRPPDLTGLFMPRNIRQRFQAATETCIRQLIAGLKSQGGGDLRTEYAARIPVLVILEVFGLPSEDERLFRRWYNDFERALSNHADHGGIQSAASLAVHEFHEYFQSKIERVRRRVADASLLNDLLRLAQRDGLSDEDVRRNALIIFFGAISTVEAIILNTFWSLFQHPQDKQKAFADPEYLRAAIQETLRWLSPVQSATRHTRAQVCIGDVVLPAGQTVNCMLGSANRDGSVFEDPDKFWVGRPDVSKHLAFATGPHLCLGRNLALLEAQTAVWELAAAFPGVRQISEADILGHEFRQPHALEVSFV